MGRHSRPTPAQLARASSLKAVAALGVAGTIAFGLNSSMGGAKSTQARSDVNTHQEQSPDTEPIAGETSESTNVSPSESAKSTPVLDRTGGAGQEKERGTGGGTHHSTGTPAAKPSAR